MPDFFDKQDPAPAAPVELQAPSNIKVGEAEYSQEELTKLVGLG